MGKPDTEIEPPEFDVISNQPKTIELGTVGKCKSCGERIEYVGPYWRHIDSTPRHPAVPKADS